MSQTLGTHLYLTDVTPSGGFFAGKIAAPDDVPSGGRFGTDTGRMGVMYRARYFNEGYFEALKLLKGVAVSLNRLTIASTRQSPN